MKKINILMAFLLLIMISSCSEEKKDGIINKEKVNKVEKQLKKTAKEVKEGAEEI